MRNRFLKRLDAHFAACAAVAATAAVVAPQQAEAAIVYSGPVNIVIPDSIDGIYMNVVTGATASTNFAGYDINPYTAASSPDGFHLWGPATSTWFNPQGVIGGNYNLPLGTPITGAAAAFFRPGGGTNVGLNLTLNSTNNYLGFMFVNEALANQVQFGWLRLSVGANAATRTIIGYAYENTGAAINAGATGVANNCLNPLPACAADVAVDGTVNVTDLLAVISGWGQSGPPRPAADCGPLPNGDCTVNVTDLLAVISAWGTCAGAPTGACVVLPGTCSIVTQTQCTTLGGIIWEAGQTCADNDGDRIPNFCELNNCAALSGGKVGTNPNVADTDGDLIKDGDEIYGTTAVPSLNLPALGANALRKNYFIEVDWFDDATDGAHTHRPIDDATNALISAFNLSPVSNICGGTGITLVVDKGQGGALTGGNLIPGGDTLVLFDTEFNTYKATHFAANRTGYFYYSIHCHSYDGSGSSGIAEINGDDHIVSLQTFLGASDVSKTMMHEFGHNIGLRHGGGENRNWKPNYNSIMNYRFQFPGIDSNCNTVGDGVLNYSIGARADLNESALLETNGVCSGVDIDWNGNAVIDPAAIARNINCSGATTTCGSAGTCYDSTCDVLTDFNDWANIVFTGLNDADFAPKEIITCDAPRLPSEQPGRKP